MGRKLLRVPAAGRNQINIEVSVAFTRESDPLSIGREAPVNIARPVHGQALNILAILVGGPDVSEIAEDNPTVVIMRIAHQPRFATEC